MSSRRLFLVLAAVLVLVNGAGIAALILGGKYLDTQSAKLTELKVEANTLDAVQNSLVKAKKDVETYSELATTVESVVPQEKDQAKTVREIIKIADYTGVGINSINFPTSSLGNAPSASSAASTSTQTKSVDGITGVEQLEITITSAGAVRYDRFLAFLEKLEQNRRTSQVSSITLTPEQDNRNFVRFSMILNVYIKKAGS